MEAFEEAEPSVPIRWARIVDLWQRIRSGEEPVAFGAVVLVVAVAAGLVWLWAGARSGGVPAASAAPGSASEGGPPSSLTAHAAGPTSTTSALLAVHVAGAVARPGLYHLPAGSRVADALARAGGKRPRGDLDRLNLAAKLADGQKILVPRLGEPVLPVEMVPGGQVGSMGGPAGESNGAAPVEPIDLNTADLAALDSLPGIGPATARAILEERARRGGFRSTRDLLRVPGIGEGRFARLRDRVRV
ncbi:MAG TPA: ComEA family DNA-binding protein [Acidimicrobiia bacterium]|nr:ComEA family DNA-binding protein [Acidimicrobiia bacterium]